MLLDGMGIPQKLTKHVYPMYLSIIIILLDYMKSIIIITNIFFIIFFSFLLLITILNIRYINFQRKMNNNKCYIIVNHQLLRFGVLLYIYKYTYCMNFKILVLRCSVIDKAIGPGFIYTPSNVLILKLRIIKQI